MGFSVSIRKALPDFTLEMSFETGNELTVLFGRSGAGKSATFRMVAGFVSPDEGRIALNGQVYFDSGLKINLPPNRRELGYVFQDLALFPHMSVRENILFGMTGGSRGQKEAEASRLLRLFDISAIQERRPREISGGQKQRVALARALATRPRALLLDEPFSALDDAIRRRMQRLLLDVRMEFRIPVLLITHDRTEAELLADRIIFCSEGRVVDRIGDHINVVHTPM